MQSEEKKTRMMPHWHTDRTRTRMKEPGRDTPHTVYGLRPDHRSTLTSGARTTLPARRARDPCGVTVAVMTDEEDRGTQDAERGHRLRGSGAD